MRDFTDNNDDDFMLSSTNDCTGHQSESSVDSSAPFAKKETKLVSRSKILVLAVILAAAIACGTATYFIKRNAELEQFKIQFGDFATQIEDVSHLEAASIVGMVESMSATITSYALSTEAVFPKVQLPHFEIRGSLNNAISKALQLSFAPLVKRESKQLWEKYAQATSNHSFMSPAIYRYENFTEPGVDFGPGHYAPVWQQSPAPTNTSIFNFDLLSHPVFAKVYHAMWETQKPVFSEILDLEFLVGDIIHEGEADDGKDHPHSFLLDPVYKSFDVHDKDDIIGFVVAVLPWDSYFTNTLHEGAGPLYVILHDTCDQHHTYMISGADAIYIGEGDYHDRAYDDMERTTQFAPFLEYNFTEEHCSYYLKIYPCDEMEALYTTNQPILYAFVIGIIFVVTAMVFVLYDYFVSRRNNMVMTKAKRTTAIVSSLFPKNVAEKLMDDAGKQAEYEVKNGLKKKFSFHSSSKSQLKEFLGGADEDRSHKLDTKPIAELFPSVTVMFADIVGFTAWSSVREPCQVFVLLETIYQAFDTIAKLRRVFKVETIGDCYVAVAGLPDVRHDHGVVMARFARDCLHKMNSLTKQLETTLGPDTGDLSMRFGLHSGAVTAGVLRGDKARFQLFGDTVNTASRMESTGSCNRIHVSQETAELLKSAGKGSWITPREDRVRAKGKGELQTFWLRILANRRSSATQSGHSSGKSTEEASTSSASQIADASWIEAGLRSRTNYQRKKFKKLSDEKIQRLVDWNTDVMVRLLKEIVGRRHATKNNVETFTAPSKNTGMGDSSLKTIDELVEIIKLPEFDAEAVKRQTKASDVVLDKRVSEQLHHYVETIASLYRSNAFHNFDHASHVCMSVTKLLSRIVAPSDVLDKCNASTSDNMESTLHDHTYGITSDPLTQFACVFAALIHDVDHSGVPNAQLVAEKAPVALAYDLSSPAEQNSIDLAWALLLSDKYDKLRSVIWATSNEMQRFRQLVVNSVLATDIADKELKNLRNARWANAFSSVIGQELEHSQVSRNRKATIVIEHLIQASDIAHTMQHWHIYRKWNERLFHEMLNAYRIGRATTDPAEFWYKGELGFFDFYIIPLAKKLKECGVFGVSSDEYLLYAIKNRQEWELRGQEVVASMVEKYKLTGFSCVEEDAEGEDTDVGFGDIQDTEQSSEFFCADDRALQSQSPTKFHFM